MELCQRCMFEQKEEQDKILQELAYSKNRTVRDLLKYLRDGGKGSIRDKVLDHVKKRVRGEEPGDHIKVEDGYEKLADGILPADVEGCLERHVEQGDLKLEKGQVIITQKGGQKLADIARVNLENLMKKREAGTYKVKEVGYGLELALSTRKYKYGDAYGSVDIQKTLLNSLKRKALTGKNISDAHRGRKSPISLEREDFEVFEKNNESKISMALLIDESGSMGEEKRDAAISTCLALARTKRAGDTLKVIVYSSQIKEIPYWEILNINFPGGTTDIKAALMAGRRALCNERGNKQVYLITDTEPNTENGKYVGFEKAAPGVKKEALQYRREDITLNIIMLGEKPGLKDFASQLAKINAGCVFFTSSDNLGRVIIEDYLSARKSISGRSI